MSTFDEAILITNSNINKIELQILHNKI